MAKIELTRSPLLKTTLKSRYPQLAVFVVMLVGYIFAIMAGLVGTPVGSHNFSIIFMNGDMDMAMQSPANFTDAQRMLGPSPALLEGKILRGGMGTGMPMWGSIFTEDQIQDLVAYIYSLQFEYQK